MDETIKGLIDDGYVGTVLSIDLRATEGTFADVEGPLHWRQDRDLSGYNTLTMGIWYEALTRWVGPATKVMALSKTFVSQRRDASGKPKPVAVPDHVDILCEMACGAQTRMVFSAITGLARRDEVWIFGSVGTLYLDGITLTLRGGHRGDRGLVEIPTGSAKRSGWRTEQEFVNAICGKEKVTRTTFEDGVKYMEFTEAVISSAREGRVISLPL